MSTLLPGVNLLSYAQAFAVNLQSLDVLSGLYTIKGEIIIALACVCLAGAVVGAITVIGDIAALAWNQICRYTLELRARLQTKAEELRLREEQIRLREEQIELKERELAQLSTLQIDADIQLCGRLAQVFEYCAYTSRARVHELEIQRGLFADMAAQDEFGGN
ncbi:hypothetical protein DFH05DRAFT_1520933 [Lentinula detonsa]|uniref:Uncharacterized protein n=1 Tax=Lentinula detonsa TaxID=2804962 RepID=A0A9W8P8Y6_9AGAR|nr:hypothetical protein DFH05DRAFT_1520933 [Lentinula detonsa]